MTGKIREEKGQSQITSQLSVYVGTKCMVGKKERLG